MACGSRSPYQEQERALGGKYKKQRGMQCFTPPLSRCVLTLRLNSRGGPHAAGTVSRRRLGFRLEGGVQYDDHYAHVVARAKDQAVIDQLLADGAQIPRPLFLRWRRSGCAIRTLPLRWRRWRWRSTVHQQVAYFIDDCLRRHDIPDPVAGEDHKLVPVRVTRLHNHL